jgi:hypothetical protein
MATYVLRRFSCPETLQTIAPRQFLLFLHPHRHFFQRRGITLPLPNSGQAPDYEQLARAFLSPDDKTPRELIDALYFVDELATPEGMDALLAEAGSRRLALVGTDLSPADVAVQMWLLDRDVLERKHAERHLAKVRCYASYQPDHLPAAPFRRPSDAELDALARSLDDWFESRLRGRGTRVIMCDRCDGVWFLVRHGEPFKREESIEGLEASSVCYRPLKYDVLVYQPALGELRVNARSKGEKELYRLTFGKHLFGHEDFFPGTEKYTLAPLREDGAAALRCADVAGIDWVKLSEVQFFYGGHLAEILIRKSDNVFASLQARGQEFPGGGRILRATFRIKFTDCKVSRSVVIRPSNIAQYMRDDDSELVEAWLAARGFIIHSGMDQGEPIHTVLGSA